MEEPRHPQVFRSWKLERLKQREQHTKTAPNKGALPKQKKST